MAKIDAVEMVRKIRDGQYAAAAGKTPRQALKLLREKAAHYYTRKKAPKIKTH